MLLGPDTFYRMYIAPSIGTFISYRAESVARSYFVRQARKDTLGDVLDIGTYWYDDRKAKKNGEFEYFSEGNNLELKETHIELSGITSFSPFVLIYTKAEVDPEPEIPEFTTYYDLHITQSVGAKLVSRHGKDQVEEGGSFTLSLEKEEGYEDCNPTVYVKRGRSGEWQEVKLDEVSGYYQIRDVYTDIYVMAEGAMPTGIEEITGVKVYTHQGSLFVYTPKQEQVIVVSMNGTIMKQETQVGLRQYSGLHQGIYIISVGKERFKVKL